MKNKNQIVIKSIGVEMVTALVHPGQFLFLVHGKKYVCLLGAISLKAPLLEVIPIF